MSWSGHINNRDGGKENWVQGFAEGKVHDITRFEDLRVVKRII
jgi:hypothetical protein